MALSMNIYVMWTMQTIEVDILAAKSERISHRSLGGRSTRHSTWRGKTTRATLDVISTVKMGSEEDDDG